MEREFEEMEEDLMSGVFHGTETLWFGGSTLLLPHDEKAPRWRMESGEVRTWRPVGGQEPVDGPPPQQPGPPPHMPPMPPPLPPMPPPMPPPQMPPMSGGQPWPTPAALGLTAVSADEIGALTTRLAQLGSAGASDGVGLAKLVDAVGDASRAMHALRTAIDLSAGMPDDESFRRQLRTLQALLLLN